MSHKLEVSIMDIFNNIIIKRIFIKTVKIWLYFSGF